MTTKQKSPTKNITTPKLTSQKLRIAFIEPVLIELICGGCQESLYEMFLLVSPDGNEKLGYPDNLDAITDEIFEDKNRLRHIVHTTGHGYAYCGMYKAEKVWRVWEDPRKTTLLENEAIRDAELETMSPEIAEKFRQQQEEREPNNDFKSAVEKMLSHRMDPLEDVIENLKEMETSSNEVTVKGELTNNWETD